MNERMNFLHEMNEWLHEINAELETDARNWRIGFINASQHIQ